MNADQDKPNSKPGPTEERLEIDMDWEDAAKRIIKAPPAEKLYTCRDPEGIERTVRIIPPEEGGLAISELVEDGSIPRVPVEDVSDRSRRFMAPPCELRPVS